MRQRNDESGSTTWAVQACHLSLSRTSDNPQVLTNYEHLQPLQEAHATAACSSRRPCAHGRARKARRVPGGLIRRLLNGRPRLQAGCRPLNADHPSAAKQAREVFDGAARAAIGVERRDHVRHAGLPVVHQARA
jgi:hypothetical protein